jgi:nucleotide-binding universal stress UspA family protein
MKRILIALDTDVSAQTIALTGYHLAKSMGAETVLLHIISGSAYYSSLKYSPILGFEVLSAMDVVETDNDQEIEAGAESFLKDIKEHIGDNSIETLVGKGDIEKSILQIIADKKCDLVVMGSHYSNGIDKFFFGSVAEKVLHHCSVPLLIIPVKKGVELE